MTASSWTPDRVGLLKVLWTQGLSASQIAKKLGGVTRNAVIGKRIRLGLPDRAQPNRTYGLHNPKPRAAIVRRAKALAPDIKPEPLPKPRAPTPDPNVNIRWRDHTRGQCEMFCAGEEFADGLVCGKPTTRGAWCESCYAVAYQQGTAFSRKAA